MKHIVTITVMKQSDGLVAVSNITIMDPITYIANLLKLIGTGPSFSLRTESPLCN